MLGTFIFDMVCKASSNPHVCFSRLIISTVGYQQPPRNHHCDRFKFRCHLPVKDVRVNYWLFASSQEFYNCPPWKQSTSDTASKRSRASERVQPRLEKYFLLARLRFHSPRNRQCHSNSCKVCVPWVFGLSRSATKPIESCHFLTKRMQTVYIKMRNLLYTGCLLTIQ